MILETAESIFNVQVPAVVVHQVNCLGYGSIGLMNQVMKRWPSLFKEYHDLCMWFKDYHKQDEMLGTIQALPIPKTSLILCNAFSQKFYSDTKYAIVPEAWDKILRKIIAQTEANFKRTGILHEMHCPAKIGIGMKPEEIDELKEIVKQHFQDSTIKWVYHL